MPRARMANAKGQASVSTFGFCYIDLNTENAIEINSL